MSNYGIFPILKKAGKKTIIKLQPPEMQMVLFSCAEPTGLRVVLDKIDEKGITNPY
jgi:hypothetical protein